MRDDPPRNEKGPRQRGRPRSSQAKEKLALTPDTSDKNALEKKRGRPFTLQKHSSSQEITEEEKGPRQRGRPRSSQAKEKLPLTPETSDKNASAKKRGRPCSLQKHSSAQEITKEEKGPRQRGRPRSSQAKDKLSLTPETSDKKASAKKRRRPCSLQKHSSAQEITEDIIPKKRRRSSRTKSKTQKLKEVQYVDCDLISNEENEQENQETYFPSEIDTEEGTKLFSENGDIEKDSILDPLTTKLIPVVEEFAPLPTELVEECVAAEMKYELKEEVEEIVDCPNSVEIERPNINSPHDRHQDAGSTEEPISSQPAFCNSTEAFEVSEVYKDLERFQITTNGPMVRDNTNNEEPISSEKAACCNSNAVMEGPIVHTNLETFQIINSALLMTGSIEEYVAENVVSEHVVPDEEKSTEMTGGFEECVEKVSELGASPILLQEVSIKTTNEVNKPKPTLESKIYSTANDFSEVNATLTQVYPMLSTLNAMTFENILQAIKERYQNDLHPTGVLEDSVFRSMYTDVFQSSDSNEQKYKDLKKLVYGMTLCVRIQNKDPTISSLDSYFSTAKIYVILESIREMRESFEKVDSNLSPVESLLWFFNTAGAKLIRESLSKCCGEEEKSAKIRNINIVLEVVNSNWKNLMKSNTQGSLHSTTAPVEDPDYITCDSITPHPENKKSHSLTHKSNNGNCDMKNNFLKDLLQIDLSVKLAREKGPSEVISNKENSTILRNNSEATNSNTDQPNSAFSKDTVIMQKKQCGEKTIKKKMSCCFFCKKMIVNIARHLKTLHKNEKDVIPIMKLCKKRQKSKEELEEYNGLLKELRLKGNHFYTQQLLKNSKSPGSAHPNSLMIRNCSRFSKGPKKLKDIVMCTFCKGVYVRATFHRHLKICFTKKKLDSTENTNNQLNKSDHGETVVQVNQEKRKLYCFYCKQKVFDLLRHLLVEHQGNKTVIRYKALLKENGIESKRKRRKIIKYLLHKSRKAFDTKCTQNGSRMKLQKITRINKELSKENEEVRDLEAQTIHNMDTEKEPSEVISNKENSKILRNNSEATNSNTDQPNSAFSKDTVIVQKKECGEKTIKKKMNCCFFCKKMIVNIARHLKTLHKNEKDVIPIMKLSKKRQKSKEELEEYNGLLKELRLKGNHFYTQQLLENSKSQGSAHPNSLMIRNCSRFSKGPKKLKDIVMCTFCKGVYVRATFYRHLKICFTKKKLDSTENTNNQLNKSNHGETVVQVNQEKRKLYCFYCKQKVFNLLRHLLVEHQGKKTVMRYKALLKENSIESKRKRRKIIKLLLHKSRNAFDTKGTQNVSLMKLHKITRINKELSKENEEVRDLEAQTIHKMDTVKDFTKIHRHQINQKDINTSIVGSEDKFSSNSPVSDKKLETELIMGSNLSQENNRYSLADETVIKMGRNDVIDRKNSIGKGKFNNKLFGVELELNEEESLIDDDFTCMLRKDSLTQTALDDPLFVKVVQDYQRKNLKKKSKVFVQNILKKVKLGCEFLYNLKEKDHSIKVLSDCFLPQKKEFVFEIIQEMCEVNETTGRIGLASIAPRLLIFMRDVTSQALKYTELNKSESDEEKITVSGLILSQSSREILNFIENICMSAKLQKETKDDSSSVVTPNIMSDRGTFSKICSDRNDAVEMPLKHNNSYRSGYHNIMDGKTLSDINHSEIKYRTHTSRTSVFERRKNCCLYCKKLVLNISHHLTSRHKNSKEIIELNNLRKDTKDYKEQRKRILGELRRKGNHILNKKLLADLKSKGSHNLTLHLFRNFRRDKSGPKALKDVLLCKFCKGVFSKTGFNAHLRSCFSKKKYHSEDQQKISESENYPCLSVNESLGTPFKKGSHSENKMMNNDMPLKNQNEVKCVNKVPVDAVGLLSQKRRPHLRRTTTFTTMKHTKIRQYSKKRQHNNVIFNRQKFYCFFCNKFVSRFTKHILIRHKDKQPAIQYMELLKENPDESKIERRNIMRLLQMKSNNAYVKKCAHNTLSMKLKQRTSIIDEDNKLVNKKEKQNSNIATKTVDQDTSTIKKKRKVTRNFILKKYALSLCPSLDPHPLASKKLRELIVPRMKRDSASTIALNDALLMATASSVIERFQKKSNDRGFSCTTNFIRDGGRLLLFAQSLDKTITEFRDLLKPSKVNTVFEATKEMCGLDEKTGSVKFINTPFRITYVLNQAVAQVLEEAFNSPSLSENDKKSIKEDLDEFLNLKRIKFRSIITRWPASKKPRNISNFSESDDETLSDTSTNSQKNSISQKCSNSGINSHSTTRMKMYSSSESKENSCVESDGDHQPTSKHKIKSKMSHKRAFIPNTSCSNYSSEDSRPIQKKKWTDKQKNIVILEFKEFIKNGTNPGRRRCRELIASSEELAGRTADQVNLIIDNINKGKLKLPTEFQYLRRHHDD